MQEEEAEGPVPAWVKAAEAHLGPLRGGHRERELVEQAEEEGAEEEPEGGEEEQVCEGLERRRAAAGQPVLQVGEA